MAKPSSSGPAAFWKQIGQGDLAPVFLLYGDDSRSIDRAFAAIEEAVVDPSMAEFNVDHFYGREAEPSSVISAARTLPMMSARRLVAVRHVEDMKPPSRKQLESYLADPCPETVLVMTAPGWLSRGARKEDGGFIKAASSAGMAVEFVSPKPEQVPALAAEMIRERGKRIDPPAVRLLIELTGGEMLGLEQQIEKIVLFAGDRDRISEDDVLEAVADIRAANIFEFTDAIGARDTELALRSFQRMLSENQELLSILGMLIRHFRVIWKVQKLVEEGLPPVEVARKAGLNDFILKKNYLPRLKKFKSREAGTITRVLADLDSKMKSTSSDKEVLFQKTIIELCSGGLL